MLTCLELSGALKSELFVEVDVHGPVSVVDRHGLQGDVGADQPDVYSHFTVDLLVREGTVGTGDLGLGGVPSIGAGSNCNILSCLPLPLHLFWFIIAGYLVWPMVSTIRAYLTRDVIVIMTFITDHKSKKVYLYT